MTDQVPATSERKTFTTLLQEMLPQFKTALPAHLKQNAERYMRVALTEYRRNPDLQTCNPYSVLAASMVATGLGLEVGPGGRAYLIPYKEECTFVPGWKGLVELANRSGRSSVWTGVIYEDQRFEYQQGDQPFLRITEDADDTDPDRIAYTYAVGRITGAEWPVIERWSVRRVRIHFDRFNKVGAKHYAHKNWEMYARKVPLLQILKYMPYSPELEAAQILEVRAEHGRGLTLETAADALDGVFERIPDEPVKTETSKTAGGRRRPQKKGETEQRDTTIKLASTEELAFIRSKLKTVETVSEHDICKAFKLNKLEELRSIAVPGVIKWLSDPTAKPELM